jgi:hypothetical protein
MLRCAITLKFTDVSEMEAVCASETSVNFNVTTQSTSQKTLNKTSVGQLEGKR